MNQLETIKAKGNLLRPSPLLKRKGAKRKFIRNVSKKRSEALKIYGANRKQYLVANPRCQVYWHKAVCTGRSVEIHHIRGRVGEMLNNQSWWLATCRACHDEIHRNPKSARSVGLLK